jgi:hypothetical protein
MGREPNPWMCPHCGKVYPLISLAKDCAAKH